LHARLIGQAGQAQALVVQALVAHGGGAQQEVETGAQALALAAAKGLVRRRGGDGGCCGGRGAVAGGVAALDDLQQVLHGDGSVLGHGGGQVPVAGFVEPGVHKGAQHARGGHAPRRFGQQALGLELLFVETASRACGRPISA
jgi:hypothetical protein